MPSFNISFVELNTHFFYSSLFSGKPVLDIDEKLDNEKDKEKENDKSAKDTKKKDEDDETSVSCTHYTDELRMKGTFFNAKETTQRQHTSFSVSLDSQLSLSLA